MKVEKNVSPAVTAIRIRELQKRIPGSWKLSGVRIAAIKKAEPPEVVAARKVVARHNAKVEARYKNIRAKAEEEIRQARAFVVFGDMQKAVDLVEKLEREVGAK